MARSVYITSSEGDSGKSTVALGLLELLTARTGRVKVFRPVTKSPERTDRVIDLLLDHPAVQQEYSSAIGVSYKELHENEEAARNTIVSRFHALANGSEGVPSADMILVLGSDFQDISTGQELHSNASIATDLGSPVLLVIPGFHRNADEVALATQMAMEEMRHSHAEVVSIVANRVDPGQCQSVNQGLTEHFPNMAVSVIPEHPLLTAPTVGDLGEAVGARALLGNPEWMLRESRGLVVAAMSLPNVLTKLYEDATVIAPGDRSDLLPGLLMAHQSGTFPHLSAIILTGGFTPEPSIQRLLAGLHNDLPVLACPLDTYPTTSILHNVKSPVRRGSTVKIQTARRLFTEHVNAEPLLQAIQAADAEVVTPVMFGFRLLERARSSKRHIVLPEGEEPRILDAASRLLRLGVADLTLLGDRIELLKKAGSLGLDISAAQILSPFDPELVDRFSEEYTKLRAHKGMTQEKARKIVTDVSYFGTLMVHMGLADGMVSGSIHTTAHTIKPSFEIIKTKRGTSIVSSSFLMCLSDRVLIYGDCAVNPEPNSEQLADIAISSADTAVKFGILPRVAMLSYSTGDSGHGAEVDKVRAATEIVKQRAPELLVEGPIQYDAAVDPTVGASKMPGSKVAGQATVLIFPDLNTGNNTYKAVQRSAGALAIGPVLQGLNRPVNDLSRGALVEDIVNTVAITAIQAQEYPATTLRLDSHGNFS